MERLTERVNGEVRYSKYLDPKDPRGYGYAAMESLAAYEDTGLEPEDIKGAFNWECIEKLYAQGIGIPVDHLRELVQAEQAGRLVVLSTEYTYKDGCEALRRAMYVCGTTNNAVTRYTADAIAEKLAREEVEAAPSKDSTIPCKHGISRHRNEIGEDQVYCDLSGMWMNVTLGDCLGNCEFEAALEGGEG